MPIPAPRQETTPPLHHPKGFDQKRFRIARFPDQPQLGAWSRFATQPH